MCNDYKLRISSYHTIIFIKIYTILQFVLGQQFGPFKYSCDHKPVTYENNMCREFSTQKMRYRNFY